MIITLIIVSLYGGMEQVPMRTMAACEIAAEVFNGATIHTARAYCIIN